MGVSYTATQNQLANRRASVPLPARRDQLGSVGKIYWNKPAVLWDYTEQQEKTVTSWHTSILFVGDEFCQEWTLVGNDLIGQDKAGPNYLSVGLCSEP